MSNKTLNPNYLLIHEFVVEYPGEVPVIQTMLNTFTALPTMLMFMRHQKALALTMNNNDNVEYTAKNFRAYELSSLNMVEVEKALNMEGSDV